MAAFTLTDLTLNEYAMLARLIGGDPGAAMTDPRSKLGAEALAGLYVIRRRRDGDHAVTLEQVMQLGLMEVQQRLGLMDGDPDDTDTGGDDAQTAEQLAADAAADATGVADMDPTVPPGSRGSASRPARRRRSSESAPAPR